MLIVTRKLQLCGESSAAFDQFVFWCLDHVTITLGQTPRRRIWAKLTCQFLRAKGMQQRTNVDTWKCVKMHFTQQLWGFDTFDVLNTSARQQTLFSLFALTFRAIRLPFWERNVTVTASIDPNVISSLSHWFPFLIEWAPAIYPASNEPFRAWGLARWRWQFAPSEGWGPLRTRGELGGEEQGWSALILRNEAHLHLNKVVGGERRGGRGH